VRSYKPPSKSLFRSFAVASLCVGALSACNNSGSTQVPAPSSPAQFEYPNHPGFIEFVDEDRGSSEKSPFDSVPESIAWYGSGENRTPVVRVVAHMRGSQHVIRSYGPSGKLLETTLSEAQLSSEEQGPGKAED
jgi:hypothetical protein